MFLKKSVFIFLFISSLPLYAADAEPTTPDYGWASLVPSLFAIVFALITRRVFISIISGVLLGTFILYGFNLITWLSHLWNTLNRYIIDVVMDAGHLSVIAFTLMIGAMVGIITENGGIKGMVNLFMRIAKTRKSVLFYTWLSGILVFFDDYANTLVVGNTMRPLADKFRISREKLAYIVDSTAAPVAAIAVITTWVGAEISYVGESADKLGIGESPFLLFLSSLQYAFYPALSLVLILLIIYTGKDIGPMHKAEVNVVVQPKEDDKVSEQGHWLFAVLPVVTMVLFSIVVLIITGYNAIIDEVSGQGLVKKVTLIMGNADAYKALLYGSATGLVVAFIMSVTKIKLAVRGMASGTRQLLPIVFILIAAWSLSVMTEDLGTATYLTSIIDKDFPLVLLPAGIFLLAALISFVTGSSWGTMAIMYPVFLPFTWTLGVQQGMEEAALMPLFHHVISVILAGSVFGDHCSPISDTTILSSMATGCDHTAHVRTQLPYAAIVAITALLLSVCAAYFTVPWYLLFSVGILLLFVIVKVFFKRIA